MVSRAVGGLGRARQRIGINLNVLRYYWSLVVNGDKYSIAVTNIHWYEECVSTLICENDFHWNVHHSLGIDFRQLICSEDGA